MKLTELYKNIIEATQICIKEKVNPEIWVYTNYDFKEIETIKLEIKETENNEKIAYITFITEK